MTTHSPLPMAQHPTSLKIPMDLKERIDRLAREGDETPHALMVRALESAVTAMFSAPALLPAATVVSLAAESGLLQAVDNSTIAVATAVCTGRR